MILSDHSIRRKAEAKWLVQGSEPAEYAPLISPFVDANVGPCSVDFTLGDQFIRAGEKWTVDDWDMVPDEFLLATTVETVNLPAHLVAQVRGKSSWMRRGLQVCSDAGYIDAGFHGQITLELKNLGHEVIRLVPGMKICQLVFVMLDSSAEVPYGHKLNNGHYHNQVGVKGSAL